MDTSRRIAWTVATATASEHASSQDKCGQCPASPKPMVSGYPIKSMGMHRFHVGSIILEQEK
jgi:hypothetical protein